MVAASLRQAEQYRAGKTTIIGFFVGQVMKASKGQAQPELVNELLTKKASSWQLAASNWQILQKIHSVSEVSY